MNIAIMRSALAEVYPRRGWKSRVADMSDEQVFATYKRMEREGQLYVHRMSSERKAVSSDVPQEAKKPLLRPDMMFPNRVSSIPVNFTMESAT